MIDNAGLIDLGFDGNPFTWTNKRAGLANIQERLDRGMVNAAWKILFPRAKLTHLTAFNSDHRPILLDSNPLFLYRPKPFRFESMWTREASATEVIHAA